MLREVTSSFCVLVIFFDFSALGGPGFRASPNPSDDSPPPGTTENQYFQSPEHQKSIFSVPGVPKINIFSPRSTKNQYFLSQEHQTPSAVAGTQLCCALDISRVKHRMSDATVFISTVISVPLMFTFINIISIGPISSIHICNMPISPSDQS